MTALSEATEPQVEQTNGEEKKEQVVDEVNNTTVTKKKNKKKKKATNGNTETVEKKDDENAPNEAEDSEDEQNPAEGQTDGTDGAKKKKKKKKSKKKSGGNPANGQSEPPQIPVSKLFQNGIYPEGEMQDYKEDNLWRTTSEEKRHLERMNFDEYNSVRKASEVHRQVRKYAQKVAKPGMSMIELCETIENGTRALIEENGLEAGV
ncbi:Methionine aminopeptidase 2 [Basidiobolus ranarum]|uniref:Methionine aminopeptidase 2 n=1 Tax=Basidiobolus ranarum TaxID=34480 RepID=A0ABR2VV67_9FUNG